MKKRCGDEGVGKDEIGVGVCRRKAGQCAPNIEQPQGAVSLTNSLV